VKRLHVALLAAVGMVFVWSAIEPHDYFTWFMEVFPAIIGAAILFWTYRTFPLTHLAYTLIAIHMIILMVGGHYTYAEVPLFNWIRDNFHLARNHYDRVGHFAQGFVPAIITREILLRRTPLLPGAWLNFLTITVCQAISAWYEFIEWWTAVAGGAKSDAFLGTQGDPWDTQWDMFTCLIGVTVALLTIRKLHDRQLRSIE
jgi:putative membrane protein